MSSVTSESKSFTNLNPSTIAIDIHHPQTIRVPIPAMDLFFGWSYTTPIPAHTLDYSSHIFETRRPTFISFIRAFFTQLLLLLFIIFIKREIFSFKTRLPADATNVQLFQFPFIHPLRTRCIFGKGESQNLMASKAKCKQENVTLHGGMYVLLNIIIIIIIIIIIMIF